MTPVLLLQCKWHMQSPAPLWFVPAADLGRWSQAPEPRSSGKRANEAELPHGAPTSEGGVRQAAEVEHQETLSLINMLPFLLILQLARGIPLNISVSSCSTL